MSDRFDGARAISLRREPIPAAYRIFFRHIGLDPDLDRTPIEAAVLARLIDGGFVSKGLLEDILLIAMIDTGVPVWAIDAETIDGPLGIRLSRPSESLGPGADARSLQAGRLVVADSRGAVAELFDEPAKPHRVHSRSQALVLYALVVEGVPWLSVEEALWICSCSLEAGA